MTSMFRWYKAAQEKEQLATKTTSVNSANQNKDASCGIWGIYSSDCEKWRLFGCDTVESGQHLHKFWRKLLNLNKNIVSHSRRQYSSNWYQVGLQPNEHKTLQRESWGDIYHHQAFMDAHLMYKLLHCRAGGESCVLFIQGAVFRACGPIYLIPTTSKLALYAVSENQGICVTWAHFAPMFVICYLMFKMCIWP
jgi:hypothetical protein